MGYSWLYGIKIGDKRMLKALVSHTTLMYIYKHDPSNSSWMVVKNIGDEMVFIGYNSSLSVRSHDFPGYEKNCIYFTDNTNDCFDF